jgi:hypothetical protein
MTPDRVLVYSGESTERIAVEEGNYYMPKSGVQVAVDAFFMLEGFFNMIQFTGGRDHDIKDGLEEFLKRCDGLPPKNMWRFIFVIPDDLKSFDTPQRKSGSSFPLFTASFSMPV